MKRWEKSSVPERVRERKYSVRTQGTHISFVKRTISKDVRGLWGKLMCVWMYVRVYVCANKCMYVCVCERDTDTDTDTDSDR